MHKTAADGACQWILFCFIFFWVTCVIVKEVTTAHTVTATRCSVFCWRIWNILFILFDSTKNAAFSTEKCETKLVTTTVDASVVGRASRSLSGRLTLDLEILKRRRGTTSTVSYILMFKMGLWTKTKKEPTDLITVTTEESSNERKSSLSWTTHSLANFSKGSIQEERSEI